MSQIENWKSPMNRLRFLRAIRDRENKVTLRDGRVFKLRYIPNPFHSKDEEVEDKQTVLVIPERGFAPMGYFRISQVTAKEWVTESDRRESPPGMYVRMLLDFIKLDLAGIQVDKQWPELEGKDINVVKRGFATAKSQHSKQAENIKVIKFEDQIFLVKEDANGTGTE
jgi:hypothetical protein